MGATLTKGGERRSSKHCYVCGKKHEKVYALQPWRHKGQMVVWPRLVPGVGIVWEPVLRLKEVCGEVSSQIREMGAGAWIHGGNTCELALPLSPDIAPVSIQVWGLMMCRSPQCGSFDAAGLFHPWIWHRDGKGVGGILTINLCYAVHGWPAFYPEPR